MSMDKGAGDNAQDGDLNKALNDLEKAQEHQARARAEEAAADREIGEAIEEVKAAEEHDRDRVEVHVTHVNDVEHASFKERRTATLGEVWDRSYKELKIVRKEKDIFQTAGDPPKSLMTHLGLTLEEAHKQKVITDYRFGIVSETGGA
ncbi:MAG TPA: hypothetical protein VMU59_09325 [Caulobacteraceae bacterium]|nr:hypothetical protein [Caulobacteraceae bacterium]